MTAGQSAPRHQPTIRETLAEQRRRETAARIAFVQEHWPLTRFLLWLIGKAPAGYP